MRTPPFPGRSLRICFFTKEDDSERKVEYESQSKVGLPIVRHNTNKEVRVQGGSAVQSEGQRLRVGGGGREAGLGQS